MNASLLSTVELINHRVPEFRFALYVSKATVHVTRPWSENETGVTVYSVTRETPSPET